MGRGRFARIDGRSQGRGGATRSAAKAARRLSAGPPDAGFSAAGARASRPRSCKDQQRRETQIFSNESTGTTNTVAPPTCTSTG
ncbi:MAG: hypothetical protein E6I00_05605 [Chloroflexi bacterium]|nr:MAG: hypothetical protein E6I00_05605 [Chloroflexota bacterium]